ncbi:alpha/beta hydrolase [Gordonia aurantiaca]|uniref:alpha/beta hydrolase n=1 Tax=Gordonia sp. B21 TaxID=3151852 RepID=UPI0032640D55
MPTPGGPRGGTPPTISELKSWNLASLDKAGLVARDNATTLDGAIDGFVRAMDATDDWEGLTKAAALDAVRKEQDHAQEVRNVLHQFADEAADAAQDLEFAKDHVLGLVEDALRLGLYVSDTGKITEPEDPDKRDEAATLEYRIKEGLRTAGDLDTDYGTRLKDLAGDLGAMINGQPDVTLPNGRKIDADDLIAEMRGMSPEDRRAMLEHMSSGDIRRLVQADPEFMGNTDGVPFVVRANANEVNIRNAIADEIQKGNDQPGRDGRLKKLRELLQQVDDPYGPKGETYGDGGMGFKSGEDGKSERMIIAFQNTPNGRIIEMVGKMQPGIRNAAVYVPGTGTNLDVSGDNLKAAQRLAEMTGGPVFFYMDGDLPQDLGDEGITDSAGKALSGALKNGAALGPLAAGLGPLGAPLALGGAVLGAAPAVGDHLAGTAADPSFARDMAPRLVSFGRELDAELDAVAPSAETTYIGHSYGGSVVGSAEQLGLNADRVLYASSAGTGVFDGGWNNPNPDVERYSMTAPGDMIHYIQSLPMNPHGSDPDSMPGVTRLDTGYYGPDDDRVRRLVQGTDGHGNYWNDPKSDAFQNMVKVITGDEPIPYEKRVPDRPTDDAWSGFQWSMRATPFAPFVEPLDGDIDMPGPIPDIPLRLPWR